MNGQLPSRYKPLTKTVLPGGFGNVQRVRDTFLQREVLFKSMQDPANNGQLLSEIRALAKARSRHVVEIYDVVVDAGGIVVGIVIEYLTGREYLSFHIGAQDDVPGYLKALYQLATALRDLHAERVVHRDLKLENFRDSSSGILKLFDFGISTVGTGYHTLNNRGTYVYAAPELYVAGATITPEMDIYALGICAWALAQDTWPPELQECPPQVSRPARSIDSVKPGWLPAEIAQSIDSCLTPDPQGRPTAVALRQLFAKHLARGRHRGLFVQGNKAIYELSDTKRNVTIKIGALGELKVAYDDLTFKIVGVTGNVLVNNQTAVIGAELPASCVLTFGSSNLGAGREWVTFSSSHPEVIL